MKQKSERMYCQHIQIKSKDTLLLKKPFHYWT